jgi:hypothetical protein
VLVRPLLEASELARRWTVVQERTLGRTWAHVTFAQIGPRIPRLLVTNTRSCSVGPVADLPIFELVENRRRSVAMLPVGAPVLDRDEALELLDQLKAALLEVRRLRGLVGGG